MQFSTLAEYVRRLEETASRSALVAILAEVFRATAPDEVAPTTYLLQGRLAPVFRPIEFGMGLIMVTEAIARAYHTDRATVTARFDRLGDLGTVAGQLAAELDAPAPSGSAPGVHDVCAQLLAIAQAGGAGSGERKVGLFSDLLATLDPLSATFVCRIPLGTLRLGVGDPTILDAYSVATAGSTRLRPQLERAYNETSDLGLIGATLMQQGIDAVDALTIQVGNPVRPALAERLPSAEAILARLGPCAVEMKYDGFRCQIHKMGNEIRIYSRSLEEMTDAFPDIAAAARSQIAAERAIIEGEALAYNPLSDEYLPFQQTMRRRRKHGVDTAAAALPLRLFAFDILYADGEIVTGRGYDERHALLMRLVQPGETILISEAHPVDSAAGLTAVFDQAIANGLEGIMAKKPAAPYQAGARNYNWVKLKRAQAGHLRDTVDCVIIGYLYGRGRRASFGVGALLVAVYDQERDVFPSVTKIGTGLTDAEWHAVRERCAPYISAEKPARVESTIVPSVWVAPQVVIEVLADEITRSPLHAAGRQAGTEGYALRFPRLISFRDADKRPEDATTVAELIELYDQQGGSSASSRPAE
ncbi:MAG TPA: ATP-dependent DNA ligase [Chloroflexota bacterium]|nr:ATP-dependent DNA ligase [Chloroflexota bacterium]